MRAHARPQMPSSDFDRAIGFYERLGFTPVNPYAAGEYLTLKHAEVALHFFDASGRAPDQSGAGAYIHPPDAWAWSRAIAAVGLPVTGIPGFAPTGAKPWGTVELSVVDPHGNPIRAGHDSDTAHG